ncbi:MAG: response regulator receiver protein [Parcubacteria group bacterium Gr01-1014_18]|nr:MAG: response regulator receiver protein [Parcubacteria group bacterium Greene0416_36]TSC81000.1 MAG: response regulator receiver protein [Parcubacteria group bacterium Gr01-1014_18]TSC98887.1 MAG: response regulator receiver protein [Parcubacteria group bacterium Greene1014_20]TSD06527.1 MAG: response regulator receiver protein [Parcubacteria group bacterium Greene0714_2]
MKFTKEILQIAANKGSQKVAEAMRTLSNYEAKIFASKAEFVPLKKAFTYLAPGKEESVIVYSAVTTAEGFSVLMVSQKDALVLADLLAMKTVGVSKRFTEMERSAVSEVLNVLSNSYVSSLVETAGLDLEFGPPCFIEPGGMEEIVKALKKEDVEDAIAVIFDTRIEIANYGLRARLAIIILTDGMITLEKSKDVNKNFKVLIADDSSFMRKMVRDILQESGFSKFVECGNGKECLKHFEAEKPDLITLDLIMPEMDGMEVLKKIGKKANIVVVSAVGQTHFMEEAKKYGAIDYITKPFDRRLVGEKIRQIANQLSK